jgi:hypothetical protein
MELCIYSGDLGGKGISFDTNGLTGTAVGAGGITGVPFASTAPVDLSSGDLIGVSLLYLDGVVSVTLTDTVTSASYTTTENINLPAVLGTNLAYVGLTGGDGSVGSQQVISNFFFSPLPMLSVQRVGNNVLASWPSAMAPGFVLQENTSLGNTNWVNVATAPTLANGLYEVSMTPALTDQYYRLTLP